MNTYCLKFIDETDARAHLADYLTDEGEWLTASHTHALDVIGTIYRPTGEVTTSEDGVPIPAMAALDGFHVNFAGELPPTCEQFVVTPANPVRVWA